MINFHRIFRNTVNSVNWIDLTLLILNSGIGLAITDYLGYEINWVISTYFILLILCFYLGSGFIWFNPNINIKVEDQTFLRLMINVFQLLTILFFGLSIIPLIQILIVSFENLMLIYLISILCCWLLLRILLEQKIQIFGLSESISAFMICFVTPLIIINLNGIQKHEILLPISFFSFLQVIAFMLYRDIFHLDKGIIKTEFASIYIGHYSILRIISGLVIFGYFACIFQLFLLGRMKLIYPLLLTLPIGIFFVFKIFRISGVHKKEAIDLMPHAEAFVLFIEIPWIIALWIG